MTSPTPNNIPKEVLIVVSKLKDYIKQSADMNTSADVIDVLSEKVRALCDQASIRARQEGRKTLMARDFFKTP
jgi:histone H3/H4